MVRNPVLVVIGVREGGEKILLALRMVGDESPDAWGQILEDLARRDRAAPILAVIAGRPGLRAAIEKVWPAVRVESCPVHELRNFPAHGPHLAKESVREDFHRIIYFRNGAEAQLAYDPFLVRWRKWCEAAARSPQEGAAELLAFCRFPQEMWRCLRTTNVIERVHGEMRRRVKTQAALPSEEAVLNLVYGLFVAGVIRLRRLDGSWKIGEVRSAVGTVAA